MALFGREKEAPVTGRLLFFFEPRSLAKVNFTLDESAGIKVYPVAGTLMTEAEGRALLARNLPGPEVTDLLISIAVNLIEQKVPSMKLIGDLDARGGPTAPQGRLEIQCLSSASYLASEWERLKDEALQPISRVDWGPNSRRS